MMMIRFAVIGTNWITDRFLASAGHVEGMVWRAIYSRTKEKAQSFAAKYGADVLHFTDLKALAESTHIDAVYIASPNALHAEQAILLMNHGKHVICEKPLASNEQEVARMIGAARENGVVLLEAMKSTLMPNFAAVQHHLPKLGNVRRYFASYCQYSSRYDAYRQGTVLNAFDPSLSNGAMMDLGVYCIYPAVVLFGEPDRIQASGVLLSSGADGEGSILLNYSGMEAVVMYSKISNSTLPAEIQGEEATMTIDRISSPNKVEIHYRDGTTEDVSVPQHDDVMQYEIAEFARLIRTGKIESDVNSHDRSLQTMRIMDEARRQIGLVYPADASVH